MKKSITYLPKRKQEDLFFLVKEIKKRIPQTEMIILYGSYATGKYVEYDERVEFGIPTTFMSDYDILVVTSGTSEKKVANILDNIDVKYYQHPDIQTPVQFINDDIKALNKALEEGRYFYTQVKQEGIMLYDSGKSKLARRRKLKFDEIQKQAKVYFDEKFHSASVFLKNAIFNYEDKKYKMASFMLHQVCENFYYAIRLSHTLRSNLSKLSSSVRHYTKELIRVFPLHTPEEKRLFELLKAAYVEARYNPNFIVTKEDIEALIAKVELLRDITKSICEKKIAQYGQMNE